MVFVGCLPDLEGSRSICNWGKHIAKKKKNPTTGRNPGGTGCTPWSAAPAQCSQHCVLFDGHVTAAGGCRWINSSAVVSVQERWRKIPLSPLCAIYSPLLLTVFFFFLAAYDNRWFVWEPLQPCKNISAPSSSPPRQIPHSQSRLNLARKQWECRSRLSNRTEAFVTVSGRNIWNTILQPILVRNLLVALSAKTNLSSTCLFLKASCFFRR